jgi:hypothetical protein
MTDPTLTNTKEGTLLDTSLAGHGSGGPPRDEYSPPPRPLATATPQNSKAGVVPDVRLTDLEKSGRRL